MSTESNPPTAPKEGDPESTEAMASELEKAAQNWESKAEEETHAAEGKLSKTQLYRATETGMRQALHSMEEQKQDAGGKAQPQAKEREEKKDEKFPPMEGFSV